LTTSDGVTAHPRISLNAEIYYVIRYGTVRYSFIAIGFPPGGSGR